MDFNKITKTFMYGLTIFVLIILAGIITGIAIIPLAVIATALEGGFNVVAGIGLFISIYCLGWVFGRFKIKMKK